MEASPTMICSVQTTLDQTTTDRTTTDQTTTPSDHMADQTITPLGQMAAMTCQVGLMVVTLITKRGRYVCLCGCWKKSAICYQNMPHFLDLALTLTMSLLVQDPALTLTMITLAMDFGRPA